MAQAQNDADTQADPQGIPYSITFKGDVQPAHTDLIDYPYAAAVSLSKDRAICSFTPPLRRHFRDKSSIVLQHPFRDAANRFISAQTYAEAETATLTTHPLSIVWDIEMPDGALARQLARVN